MTWTDEQSKEWKKAYQEHEKSLDNLYKQYVSECKRLYTEWEEVHLALCERFKGENTKREKEKLK